MRAIVLVGVALITTACGIDQEKFEPVYRAGKEMTGATEVGVTLPKYRELLQQLSTEVDIAEDKAKAEKEKALVASYRAALNAYKDADTIWQAKIDLAEVTPRGEPTKLIMEGPSEKFFGPLVKKYHLEFSVNQDRVITAEDMQQGMWDSASKSIAAGEAIYNGTR